MSITAALRLEIYMQSYGNDVLVSVLVLYPAREGCGAGSGRSVWGNVLNVLLSLCVVVEEST